LKPKFIEPILSAIGLRTPEPQHLLADKWLNSLERAMKDRLFVQPVFVKVNTYMSREIASLMDAIDYLEDWPEERRDLMYETVVQAGYDVFEDRKPLETFEKAFAKFARKKGVAQDPKIILPRLVAAGSRSGQMSA
jgi:hypothetical protein